MVGVVGPGFDPAAGGEANESEEGWTMATFTGRLRHGGSYSAWAGRPEYEEIKAGDAVDALKASLAPQANVKRNGRWDRIPGKELVPGDLVCLALGGAVPADCRLCAGKELGVDQAALTGESHEIVKTLRNEDSQAVRGDSQPRPRPCAAGSRLQVLRVCRSPEP